MKYGKERKKKKSKNRIFMPVEKQRFSQLHFLNAFLSIEVDFECDKGGGKKERVMTNPKTNNNKKHK